MNNSTFQKGNFELKKNDILNELGNFIELYEKRPIKNNKGGMQFNNMFFFFIILKIKKPSLVIESGVFKGQSTWLIENTLPKSDIISIDIDLSQRKYVSNKSKYYSTDFKFQDLSNIPNDTLVFFDDHVNHLERLMEAKFFNIKNIVLEDNYSLDVGDFQTLKQIYNHNTFNHKPGILSLIKTSLIFNKMILNKIINNNYFIKNDMDKISKRIRDGYKDLNFKTIEKNISLYYEFPLSIFDIYESEQLENKKIHDIIPENVFLDLKKYKNKSPLTYLELF